MNPTRETASINQIRTAIRQLSVRAQLAHKEGGTATPPKSSTVSTTSATS